MTFRCAALLFSVSLVVTGGAEPLNIQLVSSVTSIKPGQPFYLALALKHAPGYHTYWKHPGIVGVPTQIRWARPPRGFKVGGIQWPEPERTYMFSIKAQGYDRDLCLPIPVYPPNDAAIGSSVTFKGQASWMCCANECNPGFKDLEITLPVGDGAINSSWTTKIDSELKRGVSEMTAWSSTAKVTGSTLVVTLTPTENARPFSSGELKGMIYFTEDGVADSNKPQAFRLLANGGVEIETSIADTIPGGIRNTVKGVLVRPGGWLKNGSIRAMSISSRRID